MSGSGRHLAPVLLLALAIAASLPAAAGAEVLKDDGEASWKLEQPSPPPRAPGETVTPVGLGRIGDIEFWAPNRGLLITAGNGSTIRPSVWAYNGQGWHQLSTVCGATDGRIVWAGEAEFWTISDGRPGQPSNAKGESPPLEDNTLCHFERASSERGEVASSYGSLAFQAGSYQSMHAGGCLGRSDCWFAGSPVPEGQVGAFHLHWNGGAVAAEPYTAEGHAVQDMRQYGGQLYESVRFRHGDLVAEPTLEPPALHAINASGVAPTFEGVPRIPVYGPEEFPEALDFLHLSADEESLWAAGGPQRERPERSEPGQVTVARLSAGGWTQLLGPSTTPSGAALFPEDVVNSIAAEPGTGGAWMALDSSVDAEQPSPTARALVARISSAGTLSEEDRQQLPSPEEGIGPKGATASITCPAPHDCWMATTQGWLFHLAPENERTLPADGDPAFSHLITYRPPDAGVPQVVPDAPPADTSGLVEAPPPYGGSVAAGPLTEARVSLPLLSHMRSRLVHRNTLELRFHLAVKARIRLVAKRRKTIVAATRALTFAAGERRLLLRLDVRRWPTKLVLETRALAPLPTVSSRSSTVGTVSTGLFVLPRNILPSGSGSLP